MQNTPQIKYCVASLNLRGCLRLMLVLRPSLNRRNNMSPQRVSVKSASFLSAEHFGEAAHVCVTV